MAGEKTLTLLHGGLQVSDKVGAALTLTHETSSPIVFIGTGQKYHHLKKLSVQSVISSLFS